MTALLTGGCSWQHADRVVISRRVRLQSSRRGFLFLLLLFDRAGIPWLELQGAECSRRLQSRTRAGSDGVVSLKWGTFYFQPNLHSGKDTFGQSEPWTADNTYSQSSKYLLIKFIIWPLLSLLKMKVWMATEEYPPLRL